MSYRGNEGYTVDGDYLYISFEGMRETKNQISRSIEEARGQKDNISRAIESLQVPDSVLRGYAADLVPIKNIISKEIEQLEKINLHIGYVIRRFEEVDNEFAARFSKGSFEVQEKSGLTRQSAVFGGYNQYGPFMKSNDFLYDSQRMLDYLNGEPFDKTWMLIASSRGWGPITYEEFCRRMIAQGVGYSALFGKWGARDGSLDILEVGDIDNSMSAVAGRALFQPDNFVGTFAGVVETGSIGYKNYLMRQLQQVAKTKGWGQSYNWYSSEAVRLSRTWGYSGKGVAGIASKAGTVGGYALSIIPDEFENFQQGADWTEHVADVAVDAGVAYGTMAFSGFVAARIGATIGVVGGPAGMLLGAGIGLVVGIGVSFILDGISIGKDSDGDDISIKKLGQEKLKGGLEYVF